MRSIYIQGVAKPISRLIMGTGDLRKLEEPERMMLDAYIRAGGNVFDTAHQYRGKELVLGQWLAEQKIREQVVILTKGAHHDDGSPGPRVNPQAIRKDLTESLERLGTDYVDLYALHRDDPDAEIGLIMEELNIHLEANRIRAIGASNGRLSESRKRMNTRPPITLQGFHSAVRISVLPSKTNPDGRAVFQQMRKLVLGIRSIRCRYWHGLLKRWIFFREFYTEPS